MSPGNFDVPGALLRTAGDGLSGGVADLDRPPRAPVPGVAHWYDGGVAALVVLSVFGGAVLPVPFAAAAVGLAAIAIAAAIAPSQSRAEERRVLASIELPEDTPLAPPPRSRVLATAGRVGRRRGVRDFAALAAVMGCIAIAVPLFAGRVLIRDENATHWTRIAVLGAAAFAGLFLGPLVAGAMSWLAVRQVDPERIVAASAVGLCGLATGLAGVMPTLATTAALLAVGACFVVAACRGTARCLNVAVAAA